MEKARVMELDFEEILKEKVLSAEQTVRGYLPEEEGFQKIGRAHV